MTKRRRVRATSVATASPSRPGKYQRLGEPAHRGNSIDNPIVLDDSDDEGQVTNSMEHPILQYGNFYDLDHGAFPEFQQPPKVTPDSTPSDIEEIITSPTKLFYHDTGRPRPSTPAFRCLPVLTKQDTNGKAKQIADLQLSPGWPSAKANRVVNIFLEGEPFGTFGTERHSHLHLLNLASPDLSTIHLRDIRRELARILAIDDPLSLQLEIQQAGAIVQHKIFQRGLCTRYNAAWNDHSVTDRESLSKVLPSTESWIRVRVAEYIKVQIPTKELTVAFTPASSATTRQVRELIASVAEAPVGALSLFADYVEMEDSMGYLSFLGQRSQSAILANIVTRECVNCLDDVGEKDFPFEPTTDECLHDLEICKSCIGTWITTSLDNGNWKNITCLSVDCGSILQYADVRRYSTEADMERYERFSARDALSQMPDFKWCLNPECEHGQIHDDNGGLDQILTCQICQFKRCTACDRAWHQDETCDQYTRRLAAQPGEVDASEAWVAHNSRKCPGCQSPIQKNEGCDHMTCTRCRRQFCWICQADYSDIRRQGNTAHKPHCQYHSGNVIDPHAPPLPYPPAPLPAPRQQRGGRRQAPRAQRAQAVAGAQIVPPAPAPAALDANPGIFDFMANIPGLGALRRAPAAPEAPLEPAWQPVVPPQFPPAHIAQAPGPGVPPNAPIVHAQDAQRRHQLAMLQMQQRRQLDAVQQMGALRQHQNAQGIEGLQAHVRELEVRLRDVGNGNAQFPQLNEAHRTEANNLAQRVADLQQRAVQLRAARAPISPPVVDVVAQQVRPIDSNANPGPPRYDEQWEPPAPPDGPLFVGDHDPAWNAFMPPHIQNQLLNRGGLWQNLYQDLGHFEPLHDMDLLEGFENEFDPGVW